MINMDDKIHQAYSISSKYYDSIYLQKMPEMYEVTLQDFYEVAKVQGINLKRVLDLGCGTGNHAVRMARDGIAVTGVDKSKGQIEVARDKAHSMGFDIPFFEADMSRLSENEAFMENLEFDAGAVFCSGFCYLLEDKDVLRFLDVMDQAIKHDGFLYFEFWNILAIKPGSKYIYEAEDGDMKFLRININTFDVNTGIVTLPFKHLIWKDKEIIEEFTEEHHLRCYSIPHLQNLIDQSNWEINEIYSGKYVAGKTERSPKLSELRYYAILTH